MDTRYPPGICVNELERCLRCSRVGAIDAQGGGGVEVQAFRSNRFATSMTPAEFSVFNSPKRSLDPLQLNVPPLLGGFSHRLTLKSVHS